MPRIRRMVINDETTVYHVMSRTALDGFPLGDVEKDFTIGLNIGAGLTIGNFGIDLRYERGFTENEVTVIDTNGGSFIGDRIDTRPDQLILSLSIKL